MALSLQKEQLMKYFSLNSVGPCDLSIATSKAQKFDYAGYILDDFIPDFGPNLPPPVNVA